MYFCHKRFPRVLCFFIFIVLLARSSCVENETDTRVGHIKRKGSDMKDYQDTYVMSNVVISTERISLLTIDVKEYLKIENSTSSSWNKSERNNQSVTNFTSTSGKGGRDISIIFRGLVTEQQYNDISRSLMILVVPCLLIAIIFNVMILTIFGQKKMETPCKAYLLTLSFVELLFSALDAISVVMTLVFGDSASINYVFLWYSGNISRFLSSSVRRTAFIMAFIITFERFVAVTFPLKFRKFKITRYPIVFSIFIIFLVLFLHIPAVLKYNIESYRLPKSNITGYRFKQSPIYQKHKSVIESLQAIVSATCVYFPLVACLLLNIFTIIALKVHSRNQIKINTNRNSQNRDRRDRQMTITLLVSSLMFVIFSMPVNVSVVVNTWNVHFRIFQREHFLYLMMFRVGSVFVALSNCTDFIFYFILSSKFRAMFLSIYCSRFYRKSKKSGSSSETSMDFGSLPTISSQDTHGD